MLPMQETESLRKAYSFIDQDTYGVPNGGLLSGRPCGKSLFSASNVGFAASSTPLTDRRSMVFLEFRSSIVAAGME